MSTRSTISILNEQGKYKTVYCHSDGYPSYLGKMLLEYYNTPEIANALIALGGLGMVRERLAPNKGEIHSFNKPVREGPNGGITSAYHRDRNEPIDIWFCKTKERLEKVSNDCCAEYMYVYDMQKSRWFVALDVKPNTKFVLLTKKVIKENT